MYKEVISEGQLQKQRIYNEMNTSMDLLILIGSFSLDIPFVSLVR